MRLSPRNRNIRHRRCRHRVEKTEEPIRDPIPERRRLLGSMDIKSNMIFPIIHAVKEESIRISISSCKSKAILDLGCGYIPTGMRNLMSIDPSAPYARRRNNRFRSRRRRGRKEERNREKLVVHAGRAAWNGIRRGHLARGG